MIKSVDSVEGSTKGFILPDIRHWDRIFRLFRDGVVWAIIIPSVVAGVAVLMAVGAVAVAPVVLSRKIAETRSSEVSGYLTLNLRGNLLQVLCHQTLVLVVMVFCCLMVDEGCDAAFGDISCRWT
ncbi:hypothetical protein L210DRAFT_3195209 [Boletus edulis BED1]|uniref:Uncharacterized protein n=1 Tax=Boletus edulis BED1 TaxID=1328754 RepID=A0AAD4BXX1_BOLED|nr:hypothetical protein L210DRAFT_3195209 [Boletus edulis BED1]